MTLKRQLSWVKYIPFLVIPLLAIWLILTKCQTEDLPVHHIKLKINTSPIVQKALPEQRRIFVLKLKNSDKTDFKDATLTTTGDFHTIFSIDANYINSKMADSMIANVLPLSDLRGLGFKHVRLSNGKEVWDFDLGN